MQISDVPGHELSERGIRELLPTQKIIELLRKSLLFLYPENIKNSSVYNEQLGEAFSKSFSDATEIYARSLNMKGEKESILVDEQGDLNLDFYQQVVRFVNPPREQRDVFYEELRSCLRDQSSRSPIFIENIKIYMEKGQIFLTFGENMNTQIQQEQTSDTIEQILH